MLRGACWFSQVKLIGHSEPEPADKALAIADWLLSQVDAWDR